MTQISRTLPVPTSVRRTRRADAASGSGFSAHQDQEDRERRQARFTADRRAERRDPGQSEARARTATAGLMVQMMAGAPRRGIRAEASEQARYRRAYSGASVSAAPSRLVEETA